MLTPIKHFYDQKRKIFIAFLSCVLDINVYTLIPGRIKLLIAINVCKGNFLSVSLNKTIILCVHSMHVCTWLKRLKIEISFLKFLM